MNIAELLIIALGLSMDAFAVSICKGLSLPKLNLKSTAIVGLYFGLFQAVMPVIGYLLGSQFKNVIISIDHWIAFGLLILIGSNMIKEGLEKDDCRSIKEYDNDLLSYKGMIPLALATSIDALAVGVTFAFFNIEIMSTALIIGCVTFVLSVLGVVTGNLFGMKLKSKAEIAGGIILISMGIKILLDHLNIF